MKAYRARLVVTGFFETEEEASKFAHAIAKGAKTLALALDALDGRTVGDVESGDLLTPEQANDAVARATGTGLN